MIEKLTERITFQHCTQSVDRFGNHVNVWIDFFTCSAYANTFVSEENDGAVITDDRTIIFEVRYCSELQHLTSTEYRIVFRGDAYNILSVDMMNYRRKQIHVKAQKEKRL